MSSLSQRRPPTTKRRRDVSNNISNSRQDEVASGHDFAMPSVLTKKNKIRAEAEVHVMCNSSTQNNENSRTRRRRRRRRRISPSMYVLMLAGRGSCQLVPSEALAYVEPFHRVSHHSDHAQSIANVGGTVPQKISEHVLNHDVRVVDANTSRRRGGISRRSPGDSDHVDDIYWVDRLGSEACALASEEWHQQYSNAPKRIIQQQQRNLRRPFSLLSWNILSQKLYEGQHKHVPRPNIISWEERLQWILDTIIEADADVVCLQETEYDSFLTDILPLLRQVGYDGTVQGHDDVREVRRRAGKGRRRHAVATLWKTEKFQPVEITDSGGRAYAHMARGRTLTCALQDIQDVEQEQDAAADASEDGGSTEETATAERSAPPPTLAVVNCHLEGHPHQYAARLRQLQHAMDDLARRRTRGPEKLNGFTIAGDFNCELQSSACSTYLRIGRVGRKGGLGGVHGTSAMAIPRSLLEIEEAAEVLNPIVEWDSVIPNLELENVEPHPFRRNSLVSAYPPELGQRDPREHFTYCANKDRPVAGLDQIWHSSFTLTRVALRRMFDTEQRREGILQTGLPAHRQPSDHLPIGAVFEFNNCDPMECSLDDAYCSQEICADSGVRELFVSDNRPPPPIPKPKSPVMAFAELDMLLCTCPYDSEEQRRELEAIVDEEPDLPTNTKQKPSKEQFQKLAEMKERKKKLLMNASNDVRPTLQRMLKLKKEVTGIC